MRAPPPPKGKGSPPQRPNARNRDFGKLPRGLQGKVEGGKLSFEEAARRAKRRGKYGNQDARDRKQRRRGGGGGDRSRAKPAGPSYGESEYQDLDNIIKRNITDRITGKRTRFSEDTIGLMKQELFEEVRGEISRSKDEIYEDAARRGTFRSGSEGQRVDRVIRAGLKAYTSGVRDIMLKKAMAEFDDMNQAVRDGQKWINDIRQYELGKERNVIAREQIQATITAAHISASAAKYAADKGLQGARAAAGGANRRAANALAENRRQFSILRAERATR